MKHAQLTKSILLTIAAFSLGLGCRDIIASNTLQSTGKLIYSNNGEEVIIDTTDHQVLQDEIDIINNNLGYIPDYTNAVDITEGIFYPDKNGVILISGYITKETDKAALGVNGITVYFQSPINIRNSITIPLAKGDKFQLINDGVVLEVCKFIPSK